jgi:hypothetical protein
MAAVWSFEHAVEVRSSRERAWGFWSDVAGCARVDPGVEWARIDGPFAAGAHGQTKPVGAAAIEWTLAEVTAGERAVIEIAVPGATVRFAWAFGDGMRGGATLTQRVELAGERAEQYLGAMAGLAQGIPQGMARLADAIDRAGTGPPN